MKRKILSLLLALCLVVGMVPVAASAAGSFEEQISNAADNATVTMSEDTTISSACRWDVLR